MYMGKNKVKSLQANSLKVTKKNHHHESNNNKKQLNSLIKVLRPKVYITDSFNFKQLVQELTGNGSSTMPFPVVEDVDGDKQLAIMEMDTCSIDLASVDSFEEFREAADTQMYNLNDVTFDDIRSMDQLGEDYLAYQDLESWLLLDFDQLPCQSFNGFEQNLEISIHNTNMNYLG